MGTTTNNTREVMKGGAILLNSVVKCLKRNMGNGITSLNTLGDTDLNVPRVEKVLTNTSFSTHFTFKPVHGIVSDILLSFRQHMTERYSGQLQVLKM